MEIVKETCCKIFVETVRFLAHGNHVFKLDPADLITIKGNQPEIYVVLKDMEFDRSGAIKKRLHEGVEELNKLRKNGKQYEYATFFLEYVVVSSTRATLAAMLDASNGHFVKQFPPFSQTLYKEYAERVKNELAKTGTIKGYEVYLVNSNKSVWISHYDWSSLERFTYGP